MITLIDPRWAYRVRKPVAVVDLHEIAIAPIRPGDRHDAAGRGPDRLAPGALANRSRYAWPVGRRNGSSLAPKVDVTSSESHQSACGAVRLPTNAVRWACSQGRIPQQRRVLLEIACCRPAAARRGHRRRSTLSSRRWSKESPVLARAAVIRSTERIVGAGQRRHDPRLMRSARRSMSRATLRRPRLLERVRIGWSASTEWSAPKHRRDPRGRKPPRRTDSGALPSGRRSVDGSKRPTAAPGRIGKRAGVRPPSVARRDRRSSSPGFRGVRSSRARSRTPRSRASTDPRIAPARLLIERGLERGDAILVGILHLALARHQRRQQLIVPDEIDGRTEVAGGDAEAGATASGAENPAVEDDRALAASASERDGGEQSWERASQKSRAIPPETTTWLTGLQRGARKRGMPSHQSGFSWLLKGRALESGQDIR